MILIDAGPLVAIILRSEPNHQRCVAAAGTLPSGSLMTTWPCFTEAMYLLHRGGGASAQSTLWALSASGTLTIHPPDESEFPRMAELMAQYHDVPMDLGDASLVSAAEHLRCRRLFTLDGDFRIYRLIDGSTLDLIP